MKPNVLFISQVTATKQSKQNLLPVGGVDSHKQLSIKTVIHQR